MWKLLLVLGPLAVPFVHGSEWPSNDEMCLIACQDALYSVSFGTAVETDDYFTGYCLNALLWQSTYLCGQTYCSSREVESGLEYFQHECDKYHVMIPSYDDTMANYTSEAIEKVPRLAQDDVFEEAVNNTLVPTQQFYDNALQSDVSVLRVIKESWLMSTFRWNGIQ